MKGTPEMPQCGFSRAVVQVLGLHSVPRDKLATYNVLEDQDLRDGIKEFSCVFLIIAYLLVALTNLDLTSDWPTIPQVYVGGEFVGGCDIILGSMCI